MITEKEIRHFHLFAGLGGGARGFNRGQARVGNMVAKFRCIGGVDVDPAAVIDFGRLAGVPGTHLDLFDRSQYLAFHGKEPPADWREATPQDLQRAAGGERPHIVFLSAPCKGFSGLLSERLSLSTKYQALNRLTLRGMWLMLEAWADDPPELIVFENVPRIANRGRPLLDQINALLSHYGYLARETTHDCGELGGLAQSRKRFLLVARHAAKVPAFLYEPEKRPLRAVGDILSKLPRPGDPAAGPMHRIPALQWKTWVRLAFVEAGSDWRSLNKLAVEDGNLRDYLIVPSSQDGTGAYGVHPWGKPSGVIQGRSGPSNGAFSVADPTLKSAFEYHAYGVKGWGQTSATVTGQAAAGAGDFSVADPRTPPKANRQNGFYRIVEWERPALAITGAAHPSNAAQGVADPRGGPDTSLLHGKYHIADWKQPSHAVIAGNTNGAYGVADPGASGEFAGKGKYKVTGWQEPAGTVIAGSTTGQGAFAVADPRSGLKAGRDHYLTGGHYGVVPWTSPSGAVSGSAGHDQGPWSVADPRMPAPADKCVVVIMARDGTWHRPFTTLDLSAIQSLVDPEEHLELYGLSDQAWRERIGNAVPPEAAAAIASVMGTTLLLSWAGETFRLSSQEIWVRPVAIALAVNGAL